MSLIKIENASLGYEGKTVVNDISVDIKEKDYICIVGENGSGKTTLMKALLGLLKPLSGSITYSDGLKQNEIGYLPQSSDIQRDFPASVQEVVLSGCLNKKHTFFYSKEQKKTAAENMKLTGIYDLRKKCFRELSGGQRQRVMLARALCATHKLIILDEPVTGLDPMAMADMYALIKKLNEKRNHDYYGFSRCEFSREQCLKNSAPCKELVFLRYGTSVSAFGCRQTLYSQRLPV